MNAVQRSVMNHVPTWWGPMISNEAERDESRPYVRVTNDLEWSGA